MFSVSWVKSLINDFYNRYGTELEKYIVSKNPKTLADIELYMLEYNRKLTEKL